MACATSDQALLWNTNRETLPKLFNDLNWCTRSHYEFLATDARFAILLHTSKHTASCQSSKFEETNQYSYFLPHKNERHLASNIMHNHSFHL